jgi:hypothetical protein
VPLKDKLDDIFIFSLDIPETYVIRMANEVLLISDLAPMPVRGLSSV